ncbi:hypothetical protein MTR67_007184 [Solanum verrucosum]|uniref:Metallo-beta-lactamase domain-containing protein n=1 Tax=Solanum verrucosum TaxID=315347 RepID=A0AAF0PZ68_SOLVR|nr:hypothetical protein MTR67_007184 [Solanum verrucosum]
MAAATASTSFHIRRSFQYNGNLQNSSPKRVKAFQSPTIITASLEARRPQNVSGEFFVDHTCIDCDTCRWMAPENFTRAGDMSAVFKQPSCEEEQLRALQALLSCPTSSIHTEKPPHDILEVQKTFPIPIDEHTLLGVYHCGYHSDKSFGAASYLIVRAEGNILVDSPRYTTKLENNLKMLGGARYMFLTHSDDVADHEKWSNHLGCERILHLLEKKLEPGEDESAQLENMEYKFLTRRLLDEMGEASRCKGDFKNALLMDRCGEGVKVIQRLEEAWLAVEENKVKEFGCGDFVFGFVMLSVSSCSLPFLRVTTLARAFDSAQCHLEVFHVLEPPSDVGLDMVDVTLPKSSIATSCTLPLTTISNKQVDHSTAAVEIKLEGSGPWNLGDDVTLVHTPGHTEGSVCLLYKPHKVLFTGDHFAMGELGWTIAERYNKFSVPKQLSSVKLMLDLDFEWMLPGHGRRTKFRDVEDKNLSLRAFLETKMQLL